jgi:hypothetical protein
MGSKRLRVELRFDHFLCSDLFGGQYQGFSATVAATGSRSRLENAGL